MSYFFPEEKQPKRKQRRRRFEAAKTDRLFSSFLTEVRSTDQDLYNDLPVLAARARYLEKNSDYVRRALKVCDNNIVGDRGVELRANYMQSGSPYKSAIMAVEREWKRWCEEPDVTGLHAFVDIESLMVRHLVRDGEFIVQRQRVGPYGLKLQLHDPQMLGHTLNKQINGSREIVMGVEIETSTRKPLAYHFTVRESNQPGTWTYQNQNYQRVPAEDIIHVYKSDQVLQTRGYTSLASAIRRLRMLDGYEEAALVAARAGASRMGVYRNEGDQQFEGDDEDEATGELLSDFEPGTMTELPRGYTLEAFETGWPNVDHSDYVKSVLRGVASGIGVSYNTLANDLEGVNYSSMRGGVQEDREEWKNVQRFIARRFHQRVFDWWLAGALALGLIRTPGGDPFSMSRFEQFRKVAWQGRRWDWVDPLKDMNANKIAIDYRFRSVSDVIREQGRDPAEVFAEIERERQDMADKGITIQEVLPNGQQQQENETQSED